MKREFTASVYLIEEGQVLLLYHPKLQKWLPPGGHLEINETPAEAAVREVKEETGLDFVFLNAEKISIQCWNAISIANPYLTLLENIPEYKEIPAHQHIDSLFIGKPLPNQTIHSPFSCQWFSWEKILGLQPDVDIFVETQQTIAHLLQQPFPPG